MVVLSLLGALGLGWLWLPLSSGHVAPVAKVSAPGVGPPPVHHSVPSVVALSKSGVETKVPSLTEFQMFSKKQESKAGEVVLDLRPFVDFCGQHLVGATSMPADQLERRMLELPTPSTTQSLALVGNEEVGARCWDFVKLAVGCVVATLIAVNRTWCSGSAGHNTAKAT